MTIQQMFVAFMCLIATQQIAAVVNNQKSVENSLTSKNVTSTVSNDLIAAGTEQETKRREAPAFSETYGLPVSGSGIDSYVPTGPSNPSLPIPVYGVPNAPSNNIIYPAPPPELSLPHPAAVSFPAPVYGVPHSDFGNQLNNFILPPPTKYLPPSKPHKHFSTHSFHSKPSRPRPQYGPPHKPVFVQKLHKPKPIYGPPKAPLFVPQKQNGFKQQSVSVISLPTVEYGVPNSNELQDSFGQHYHNLPNSIPHGPPLHHHHNHGPPEPVFHKPPHPGIPAPPTPPDIKYDGWKPIPGLVSRPPSDTYGVPEKQHHSSDDLHLNPTFVPPPIEVSQTHSHGAGYNPENYGVSDSYGAPLNAVTGSGAIDSSSVTAHHDDQSLSIGLSAAGINGQSHLSVVKSIGYELFPNSGLLTQIGDSYSHPPADSFSPDGPYAAARPQKTIPIKSHHSSHSNIGLVPPSGIYGAPPNSHYGTPLLSKPSHQYGPPLNALKINPPKHPVIFREPVPTGLIQSIGQHTAHKDAHGIIESAHSHRFQSGPTYIPPPIPDVTKPVREEEPPAPSGLYSLPHPTSSVSFNSHNGINSLNLDSNHYSHSQSFNSYAAPLGSIDGSYSLPLHSGPGYSVGLDNSHVGGITVGIDNSLPPVTIDLASATTNIGSLAHIPQSYGYHDCKSHGSQPLPTLTYGVPSIHSYTTSLSSLTTNLGGAQQVPFPSGSYGLPDLHTEQSRKVAVTSQAANNSDLETDYSTKVRNVGNINSIDSSHGKNYGKSLALKFGSDAELIKSKSIDFNNIPVKGNLGSYTLQIQSADGLDSQPSSGQVPHTKVLNDGLLESILAAIEQPDHKNAYLGRPLSELKPDQNARVSETEEQHSVTNADVVPAPAAEATSTTMPTPESEASLHLLGNKEIALYFSNNLDENNNTQILVRNGQQYGDYIYPNNRFLYTKLESDKPQETANKD